MNEWLPDRISERLESDQFFYAVSGSRKYLNSLLDIRDRDEFDDDWVKTAEEIQAHWEIFENAENLEFTIRDIREQAFQKSFAACGGHEVAGYISDDFEIIAKAAILSLDGSLITQLREAYDQGVIPPHIDRNDVS